MNRLSVSLLALLATCSQAVPAIAADAAASQWRRIDFDADLTSYLLNLKVSKRNGDLSMITELVAPGRTAISVGLENHLIIEREFNCKTKVQRLASVMLYRKLGSKPESLTIPDSRYDVTPASIDDIEMKFACDGVIPAESVDYSSVTDAVQKSFGDAVKLPRDQSNKTLKGLGPMGGSPSQPGGPQPQPDNAPSR